MLQAGTCFTKSQLDRCRYLRMRAHSVGLPTIHDHPSTRASADRLMAAVGHLVNARRLAVRPLDIDPGVVVDDQANSPLIAGTLDAAHLPRTFLGMSVRSGRGLPVQLEIRSTPQ